jgi:DNA (cytosine-5)-methyltransferase 1
VDGMVASPPCQGFSRAGKGAGKADRAAIEAAVSDIGAGVPVDQAMAVLGASCFHPYSPLVLQPLRWALALMPPWIALEQVPAVLPLWQAIVPVLEAAGYTCWAGNVTAEQYGVPQTRRRAILLAHLDGRDVTPRPTHRAYRRGVAQDKGDPDLLPWVSMADALNWPRDAVVGFPRLHDTDTNNSRESVTLDGVDYRARDLRSTELPAQVVTEKVRSWKLR